MATRSDEPDRSNLKQANLQLRAALRECKELLERNQRMLEASQQDNKPLSK